MNTQLPFSEELEKCVLGNLITGGEKHEEIFRTRLPLEAFFIPAHQTIAEEILSMLTDRRPVNFYTLKDRLRAANKLEECGGIEYLNSLVDLVTDAGPSGMAEYIRVVRNKWMLRSSMVFLREMHDKCTQSDADWPDIKLDIETKLLELSRDGEVEDKSLKEITLEWVDGLEKRLEVINTRGFRLGIDNVDETLGPSVPGELVIIASESSGGKTALVMQAALASAQRGLPVGVFSLEMLNEQLWDRMFSHMVQIPMARWRHPTFTERELSAIGGRVQSFIALPLYINQKRRIDLPTLASKARRLKATHDIGAIVVDYLQRVKGSGKYRDKRYLEIAEVSDELKQIALELGIVVVAPCQLNKDGEERESADIRFDADRVFIIKEGQIWVQKDRQNKRFYGIPVRFEGEYVTFRDRAWTEEEEEEMKGLKKNGNGQKGVRKPASRYSSDD